MHLFPLNYKNLNYSFIHSRIYYMSITFFPFAAVVFYREAIKIFPDVEFKVADYQRKQQGEYIWFKAL